MFCEIFSLQPFATGYTTPPAASEQNPTTAPCSVQQHPSLAPLQHELGTVRTLLAAPWSITPCSSTSRLARQHPQAAPSTASAHQHARSKAGFTAHTTLTAAPSKITLRQHLQQQPERHQHRSKLYTPLWQQATPCHQHLAAAFQRHHDARSKAHTPLWQQHAQRQQHASSKALHVCYTCQQLKHFRGKCGCITIRGECRETLNQGPRVIPTNHTHESYPESYPRIILPSQTSRVGHGILRHTHIFILSHVQARGKSGNSPHMKRSRQSRHGEAIWFKRDDRRFAIFMRTSCPECKCTCKCNQVDMVKHW